MIREAFAADLLRAPPLPDQTASEHCLPQCGIKPIVSDSRKYGHINTRLSPVGGLILPLYSVVAGRNATSRVQSISFRTSVKDPLTLLVKSKSPEKAVMHTMFEGAENQSIFSR